MTNCGIGACAASTASCIKGIISIAIDFLTSLVQFIGFIATFGAGSAITTSLKSATKGIASTAKKMNSKIKQAMNSFKRINKNPRAKKGFLNKVTEKAKKYLAKEFKGKAISIVGQICSQVGDDLMTKVEEPPKQNFDWESVDPTGMVSALNRCKGAGKSDTSNMECAGAVLDMISQVDPTGLAGIDRKSVV